MFGSQYSECYLFVSVYFQTLEFVTQSCHCNGKMITMSLKNKYFRNFLLKIYLLIPCRWFTHRFHLSTECLSPSDQTAVTKYHRLGSLNHKQLFSYSLGGKKSEIWGQHGRVLVRTLSLVYEWPSYCVLTRWREEALVSLLFIMGLLIPSQGLYPHDLT